MKEKQINEIKAIHENNYNQLISKWVSQIVIPRGYNSGGTEMFAFTERGSIIGKSYFVTTDPCKSAATAPRLLSSVTELLPSSGTIIRPPAS